MRLGLTRTIQNGTAIFGSVRLLPISGLVLQLLNNVMLAAPVVALVALGYRQRWISEDAYISLRVVEQILAGNGPVFNMGERVEAHTNPLWVAILTFFGALRIDTVMAALFLGIVLSAGGMLAAIAAASSLERRRLSQFGSAPSVLLIPIGAVVFIAVPVVSDFITSGLETGLAFGWLGLSFWILTRSAIGARDIPGWNWYAGAFVLGLGPLVRPDFAIYSAGFLLALLVFRHWSRDSRLGALDVLLIGVAAGVLPVAYQIFRMGYYAALVPNTALAKEASMSNWEQGEIYFRDFADPYKLWIPGAIVLTWMLVRLIDGVRQRQWPEMILLIVPVLTGILHAIYVIRVGGDFMHGRMLLPALFAITLPFAVTGIPLAVRPLAGLAVLIVIPLLIWSYFAAFSYETVLGDELDEETGLVDERAYYVEKAENTNPVTTEDYLSGGYRGAERGQKAHEMAGSGPPTILISDNEFPASTRLPDGIRAVIPDVNIGILGYIAGTQVHVVDRLGLAEPIGSRLELEERDRPGHEKMLSMAWVAARFTGLDNEDVSDPEFAEAREALACGELVELDDAVTEPLTFNRFMENIQRSWDFHHLRIPPDPDDARKQFC
jgi:arabinofuranosyltransferase